MCFVLVLSGPEAGHTCLGLPWGLGNGPDTCVTGSGMAGLSITVTLPSLSLQPVAVGYDLFEGRPRLAAWRERVEAFLGSDLLQETRGPILNILEQAVNKKVPNPPPEVYPYMLLRISRIP